MTDVTIKTEIPDVTKADMDETIEIKKEVDEENGKGDNTEPSSLQAKIIRQVEYYFGDLNLSNDRFLQQQIALDDGWVPMDIMLKFARLQQLTRDPLVILEALKLSKSGLMEVCLDPPKIRRTTPLEITEEKSQEIKARSVYCKGFPKEGTNLDKVLEFFKAFPTVENIKLRYFFRKDEQAKDATSRKGFKGSLTATFSTRQEAEAFMTKESVKYNDYVLIRQWLSEWEAEKKEELKEIATRKLKREQKAEEARKEEEEKVVLARGTVLKLTGIPRGVDRETIKKSFADLKADIAYVDINPDHTFVRLRNTDDAKKLYEGLAEKKLSVDGTSVVVSLLEGDEEEQYLTKAELFCNMKVVNKKVRDFRKGGRGRGGKSGQKRFGSQNGDRNGAAKKARVD